MKMGDKQNGLAWKSS